MFATPHAKPALATKPGNANAFHSPGNPAHLHKSAPAPTGQAIRDDRLVNPGAAGTNCLTRRPRVCSQLPFGNLAAMTGQPSPGTVPA